MHFVIMGCGRVGSTLARGIERNGHDVAVIDIDPQAFRRLGPEFEGRTVTGVGFDKRTLRDAGIEDAYAFAAVSSGDNSNILAARVARETFGIENVVARIYDPGRAQVYERLGIPTVATVRWAADQVLRRMLPMGVASEYAEPSGNVVLAEVPVDRAWVGRTVADIEAATGGRVAFITRLSEGLVPTQATVHQDGDIVHLVAQRSGLPLVERVLDTPPPAPHGGH